jgi:hypothetical protein
MRNFTFRAPRKFEVINFPICLLRISGKGLALRNFSMNILAGLDNNGDAKFVHAEFVHAKSVHASLE